ncbi:MAG: FtsX-like permease family protein [Coriobacteriia bacterium]
MRFAFNKEIVRSITHSWTRFIAIFAIVALGAGFYAGLRMCAPDMRITIDRYLDDTAFMDAHLISTLGFSDADVAAVEGVEGVDEVMPSHIADATASTPDASVTVRIHSLDIEAAAASDTSDGERALSADPGYLNRPILVEGRWPEHSGECVIDRTRVSSGGPRVGDTLLLTAGTMPLEDTFARTDFTIVGVVDSSYYLRFTRGTTTLNDGNIDRFIYIPETDFADPGTYTDLFLTVDGAAALSSFSSSYDELVEPVALALSDLAPERAAARLAEVKATAGDELDKRRAEYDESRATADAEFASGAAELDAATAEIASSESQLTSARRQYDAGVAELAAQRKAFEAQTSAGQAQIDAGRAQLIEQKAQLDALAAALPLLQQQVLAAQAAVTDLQLAYDTALAEEALGHATSPTSAELLVQLTAAQSQLVAAQTAYATQAATYDAGMVALAAGEQELNARQAELDAASAAAEAQFAAGRAELAAAKRRIDEGYAELAEGAQTLAEGRAEYEQQKADAEAELADALARLDDAQAEIDTLERPDWYVLGRGTNLGYASVTGDAEGIDAISLVFPLIFFLVAALVSLTTMTRMVEDERTLIGTYKALGYANGRIALKYLVYAGIASVFGSISGILIGSQVLPDTVWNAYTTVYTAPSAATPIDVPLALLAGLTSVSITQIATFVAVEATLRQGPATLMLPRAPKPGKRILLERIKPLWSRMSFSRKVTARNLFRYKKRLLMTVVGIAGCTALLLTGFGLKNSINDILDIQYGEISHYTTVVGFDPGTLEVTATVGTRALREALEDPGVFTGYLVVNVEGMRITNAADPPTAASASDGGTAVPRGFGNEEPAETSMYGFVCVPREPARLGDFIALHERRNGGGLALDDSGAVITEKIADKLGLEVGDEVRIERLDEIGNTVASSALVFPVSGITEHYVSHYVYVTPALYERTAGESPVYNEALAMAVTRDAGERDELSQSLLGLEGVTTVQYNDDITESFDEMLTSLDSVVFILILAAGMLAFIVLYNLTNINVTERQREIATIKVLGFFDSEVNAYIYRETATLALLGCGAGLLLGIGLEAFVISTVEIDVVMFGRTIHAMSYVYSAALTLLFAVIVNLAMAPRLRRIDMVESLKSVE